MLTQSETSALDKLPIFKDLAPEELSKLARLLHRRTVQGGAGIMRVAEQGEAVYILLNGTVKIHVEQSDGSDVILAILGPGEIVGDMDMVDGQGRSANAVTLEE